MTDIARSTYRSEPMTELYPTQGDGAVAAMPESPAEALAVRPMMEQIARMGDCIGQHTVGEIMAISDRAASWLRENPPGQPVAIEPRGCPTPGACSCVEPQSADGEVAEHARWLDFEAEMALNAQRYFPAEMLTRSAELLRILKRPQPPEPEGPTDDELTQFLFESFRGPIEFLCDAEEEAHLMIRSHVKFARAVLARWGNL